MRGDDLQTGIRLTVSPGVSIPRMDELKVKIEGTLRLPTGAKIYARQGDTWVEMNPREIPKGLGAVVRSFDEEEGKAHVHLIFPKFKMPVVQIWRFNGKSWSDNIDPGIIAR